MKRLSSLLVLMMIGFALLDKGYAEGLVEGSGRKQLAQAGFYTPPQRPGKMWDTWITYHEGKYYITSVPTLLE